VRYADIRQHGLGVSAAEASPQIMPRLLQVCLIDGNLFWKYEKCLSGMHGIIAFAVVQNAVTAEHDMYQIITADCGAVAVTGHTFFLTADGKSG